MVTKYGVTFVPSGSHWGGEPVGSRSGSGTRRTRSSIGTVTLLWARCAGLGVGCIGYHLDWW
jgi:hypothetical protein